MEEMKSYTVRVETGEIRLMSQEEVSKLVRTTMARAESGGQTTKKPSKFARSKGSYSIASDLSRRLSLSPRPTKSTRALQLGKNPEELAKSPTSKLFQDFRAAVSTAATSTPPEESRDDNSTSFFSKNSMTKDSSRGRDERFSALVRTVGPTVIDPENDPRDVSFTVSTEVDGPKNLSEKELHALVRSSMIRAKFNARHKKSRRKQDHTVDNDATIQSPDSSPAKRLSRKFSWSTVEKSDDEEFEDFRDEEILVVETKNDMVDTGMRQELENREQTSKDNQTAVDEMVNAEMNDISTHGSGDLFITPCTSVRHDTLDFVAQKQVLNEDGSHCISRQPESDTQLLSLVLSGGDTSISDKDICKMVKHSMAKAKLTRQEITDLLEDTGSPTGTTNVDIASMFDVTTRRTKDPARVLGVKSLSPRRRRSLGLNNTRAEAAPIHEFPSTIDRDNEPADSNVTVPIEITEVDDPIEIILHKENDKLSVKSEGVENRAHETKDEFGIPLMTTSKDSECIELCSYIKDEHTVFAAQDIDAVESQVLDLDDPDDDAAQCADTDLVITSQPEAQTCDADVDKEILLPVPIEELPGDIVKTVPHREQSNSCCFQMCCMPIILSSSSVAEKEELDRASAAISAETIEQHQEEAIHSEETTVSKLDIDCESSVLAETTHAELPDERTPPAHEPESVIDLTDANSTVSMEVSPSVHDDMTGLNDNTNKEHIEVAQSDQDPAVDTAMQLNIEEHDPFATNYIDDGAAPDEIKNRTEELNVVLLDSATVDESYCCTCFHVPMNPEIIAAEVKAEQLNVELPTSHEKVEDNELIVPAKDSAILFNTQSETKTLSTEDLNTPPVQEDALVQEDVIKEQKSYSRKNRHSNHLKYKRFKESYDVKTVITDEFLSQVISRKGSKISISELAKILKGEGTKTNENGAKAIDDNDSTQHDNNSADETIQSDRSDVEAKIDASLEQSGFCVDFMSIFSDLDLRGVDDDFGSASLFPDDSRAVTWIESAIDAESKDELTDHGTTRSIDADDDKHPKITEYESEFVASLDENERRRLTFSFSEGRYTGSLSSLDDY